VSVLQQTVEAVRPADGEAVLRLGEVSGALLAGPPEKTARVRDDVSTSDAAGGGTEDEGAP
jgi:hypothetical protein